MSIRYQADNDLKFAILDGVRRRELSISFQSASAAALDGLSDEDVLRIAAAQGRILVTHDRATMPAHLREWLARGGSSPGVFVVPQRAARIGAVIEHLVLVWAASDAAEWRNGVFFIP